MKNGKSTVPVTIGLAGINILVFLWMSMGRADLLTDGALIPEAILKGGEYYRLLTAAFLHFSANHLMNNMLMLVVLGIRLETVLGKWRFGILYLICAVGANIASVYWYTKTDPYVWSAGASGATMGLAGVLLALILKRRHSVGGVDRRGVLIVLGICILNGLTSGGVNNVGHIAGALLGFLFGWILG